MEPFFGTTPNLGRIDTLERRVMTIRPVRRQSRQCL